MALSEEQEFYRLIAEKYFCVAQRWADRTFQDLAGKDEPCELFGVAIDSTLGFAMRLKSNSVEKLARLRAGEHSEELF